ncbi:MAG: hypothetical protein QW035_03855 [Candidatus Anstonellales archaeon]
MDEKGSAQAQKYISQLIKEKMELLGLLRNLPADPAECSRIISGAIKLALKTGDEKFRRSVEDALCSIILKG